MTRKSTLQIVTVIALCLLTACRSARQPIGADVTMVTVPLERMVAQSTECPGAWTDIYMPFDVSISEPVSISISGRATMIRNSEINLSMRFWGIEVAQIYINRDSAFVIDKYHKYYFAEPIDRLLPSGIHFSVGRLQNLMTGMAFNSYPANVSEILVTHNGDTVATYTDPATTPAGRLAQLAAITAQFGKSRLNASLSWDTANAKFDTGRSVSFTPPRSGYQRITSDALLKIFKL